MMRYLQVKSNASRHFLRELDTLGSFATISYKGGNFCYFLFDSCTLILFEKGSTLKGQNLPPWGAHSQ